MDLKHIEASFAGKDLLLKVDLTGDGQFETVAGLRATRISFNTESVDVTSLESQGGWRELLAGAGVTGAAGAVMGASVPAGGVAGAGAAGAARGCGAGLRWVRGSCEVAGYPAASR